MAQARVEMEEGSESSFLLALPSRRFMGWLGELKGSCSLFILLMGGWMVWLGECLRLEFNQGCTLCNRSLLLWGVIPSLFRPRGVLG